MLFAAARRAATSKRVKRIRGKTLLVAKFYFFPDLSFLPSSGDRNFDDGSVTTQHVDFDSLPNSSLVTPMAVKLCFAKGRQTLFAGQARYETLFRNELIKF